MEFKSKPYPYIKVAEKIPNTNYPTILPTTSCPQPEFLEIMCSYGDVSKKTAKVFLDAFIEEFKDIILNCKKVKLSFGTFAGGYEDRRIPLAPSGIPKLKKTGFYSGILFYKFPKVLKQGYVHELEEERKIYKGVPRSPRRRLLETIRNPRLTHPSHVPGNDRLVTRKEFIRLLSVRCRFTFEMSSNLLEALELTVIELIRSNRYFVFSKAFIIGGYPRIAGTEEAKAAGFKDRDYIVKDYCPFCRVTSRYNYFRAGQWIGNELTGGEQDD